MKTRMIWVAAAALGFTVASCSKTDDADADTAAWLLEQRAAFDAQLTDDEQSTLSDARIDADQQSVDDVVLVAGEHNAELEAILANIDPEDFTEVEGYNAVGCGGGGHGHCRKGNSSAGSSTVDTGTASTTEAVDLSALPASEVKQYNFLLMTPN